MWRALILLALASGALGGIHQRPSKPGSNEEVFKEQCRKYGASEETILESANNVSECIGSIHPIQLLTQLGSAGYNGSENATTVQVICSKAPVLKACISNFYDAIALCAGSNKREEFKLNSKSNFEFIDFLCFNDGQRILEFVNDDGIQCLETHSETLRNCLSKFKNSDSSLVILTDAATSDNIKDFCNKTAEFKTCILDAFRACPKPGPANSIDAALQILLNGSPCNHE